MASLQIATNLFSTVLSAIFLKHKSDHFASHRSQDRSSLTHCRKDPAAPAPACLPASVLAGFMPYFLVTPYLQFPQEPGSPFLWDPFPLPPGKFSSFKLQIVTFLCAPFPARPFPLWPLDIYYYPPWPSNTSLYLADSSHQAVCSRLSHLCVLRAWP